MINKIIVIVGPTAVGKTKLGVELALKLNGEVISGDSMQIYRTMNIGTAKVTNEETKGIKHHLIDIKNIDETYSVMEFQKNVRNCIEDIQSRHKVPIIVGGTGLYIKAALYDYVFNEEKQEPASNYDHLTNEQLYQELQRIDPESALEIHFNNRRRVQRAIEIYKESGQKKSDIMASQQHVCLYDCAFIGLTLPRDVLYERINYRVDLMMKEGLLAEVLALVEKGAKSDYQSMKGIGYREWFGYIDQTKSKEEVIEAIKQNSRRYAKRQYTWFKNQMEIKWFDVCLDNFKQTINDVLNYLDNQEFYRKIAFDYHFEDLEQFNVEGILSMTKGYLPSEKKDPTLYDLKHGSHKVILVIEFDQRKISEDKLKERYQKLILKDIESYSKNEWKTNGMKIEKWIEIREKK